MIAKPQAEELAELSAQNNELKQGEGGRIRRLMNQTELKLDGLGSHDDEGGGEMQMPILFGILFLLKKIKRFGGKAPRFRWQVSSSRARIRRQRIFTASISNLPHVMFFSPCAWTFLFRGDKEHSERA